MQFFTLLAIPALAIAAAVPDPILARQVPGGLPALPLNPTCVTNCLTGVVACAPTNLASLTGLVGCPLGVILCALGCITGTLTGAIPGLPSLPTLPTAVPTLPTLPTLPTIVPTLPTIPGLPLIPGLPIIAKE